MKKMKKPIYVLGVGLSHDGSACLLRHGVNYRVLEEFKKPEHGCYETSVFKV